MSLRENIEDFFGDFPSGPIVETLPSSTGGTGLIPDLGAKILHALLLKNQNIKNKQTNPQTI